MQGSRMGQDPHSFNKQDRNMRTQPLGYAGFYQRCSNRMEVETCNWGVRSSFICVGLR